MSQNFELISHLIRHLLSKRKFKWWIVLNFVAFLKNLNFTTETTIPRYNFMFFYVFEMAVAIAFLW